MTRKQMRKLERRISAYETVLNSMIGNGNRVRWIRKTISEVEKSPLALDEKAYIISRLHI